MGGMTAGIALFIASVCVAACGSGETGQNQSPSKPLGTAVVSTPTKEAWTVAKGLPTLVQALAFAPSNPTHGYASVLVDKFDQNIFATKDRGNTWSQVGVLHDHPSDALSVDPLDPQDIISLSVYAPTPGAYTFQRSFDGGRTWTPQSTTLTVTGEISRTGWSDSTFLIGFQLDRPLQGSSAVIAFPKQGVSAHLDVNGKINGGTIAHLTLLTGRHGTIQVWGDSATATETHVGAATSSQGNTWQTLSTTIAGHTFIPFAASADGSILFATATDGAQLAFSSDAGATWTAQPTITGSAAISDRSAFVIASDQALVVAGSDGTYISQHGAWQLATTQPVIYAADDGSQHMARLWSIHTHGQIVWFDD